MDIRKDSLGSVSQHGHHKPKQAIDSLTYVTDESDAYRAHLAASHYQHRGQFWNKGKHDTTMRYVLVALVGIFQATVAYFTNITSDYFITAKYERAYDRLNEGHVASAFFAFVTRQLFFATLASVFVWIEPVSAGSGIPEVKCYLNGINLPRVGAFKTLVCKVLGVICSVSAGLPVGKEGPMVHSGAVVATVLSRSTEHSRNDKSTRDFVACGAAAGVCTAFSAPIGGILFALEEGCSYWGPSLTWRTFFCSMVALTSLYLLNTIGSQFGKVGFNKLFSFGNFVFEGDTTSYAVFELFLFVLLGMMGGLIGAIFNDTNEKITKWRMKRVNHSKSRRFVEVMVVSLIVSLVSFLLPLLWGWGNCRPLPAVDEMTPYQMQLREELIPFTCVKGEEYNEIASLMFTEAGAAIRQLFHLHKHAFSGSALCLFFAAYISLAVLVYGIAVPSGLFVPSLLSGAAFGRLFGNVAHKIFPDVAHSNTYALIGAAAVLGGMARMTISLTVILLECTGNEQFVLPLMLTLMSARIIGGLYNDDLYHIHIHLKNGINFLEAELRSITRHHDLTSDEVMGAHVVFIRPVENVGVIYDILVSSKHSNYPVVDPDDRNILFGTIGRNALAVLLQHRAFGKPQSFEEQMHTSVVQNNVLTVGPGNERFLPLVQWEEIEKMKHTSLPDISVEDRKCFMDLRPYANTSPITIQENTSVERTYSLFRSLGLRFLPVVNRYNQVVGTITRSDLTPDALADKMIHKGKKDV